MHALIEAIGSGLRFSRRGNKFHVAMAFFRHLGQQKAIHDVPMPNENTARQNAS
jgi:hypothetical protein